MPPKTKGKTKAKSTGKAAATTDAPSQAWDALNGARGKRSDAAALLELNRPPYQ